MRLGVLGGTFDPVHLAHLILGETARQQLVLDRVLFVPAGRPWRKGGRTVAAAEHRVAMLGLAIEGNAAFGLTTVEIERPGPSYAVDTLEWLQAQEPGVELFFLLGWDALVDLPHWHQPRRIRELATLAVAERPGGQQGDLELEGQVARPGHLVVVEMPLVEISASEIRERVRSGRSIRYLVPDAVEAYIREHGLYRA